MQRQRDKDLRTLVSNLPYQGLPKTTNRYFPGNSIKTTKYSFWFFIPMNLWEQFHRFANIYFVGLALLNFVPAVEAFQPEVALIPICIILTLTALKDGWEDYRRKEGDVVERRWKDVRVGDFGKVVSNENLPADLLLLQTSDPNGVCHVETATLDGETNLKQRQVVPGLYTQGFPFKPQHFNSNDNLNHFKGYIETADNRKLGFGIDSLLLRGCTVRNTDHAAGFVVYTGALGHYIWLESFPSMPLFLIPDSHGHLDPPPLSSFYMFFTMIILLQILIPISLYVSIEIVKAGQVFFITNNIDLYDEETDSGVQCRTLNITEDLGQIQYVFGTLTENKMVFRRCTVMGTEYAHNENDVRLAVLGEADDTEEEVLFHQRPLPLRTGWTLEDNHDHDPEVIQCCHGAQRPHRNKEGSAQGEVAFSSPLETEVVPDRKLLQRVLRGGGDGTGGRGIRHCQETELYLDFFLSLAVCNTVVVSTATQAQAQRRRVSRALYQVFRSSPPFFSLHWATGIEDRLQDSVPDTIMALREAGIQVWVLTGDKPETAVNIAYACRLLYQGDLVINMRTNNKAMCASTLDCTLEEVRQYGGPGDHSPSIGLVIDGHTLGMALESDLVERFVELARHCRSVLCCRAVMASDFSISCFKHVKKLLLVHGTSSTVVSRTSMIDIWLIIFFNLFFTSAPPIMFGVMDRNFATETLLGLPELYRSGQGSEGYNHFTFWIAMLDAFNQSLVCFFIPFWTYHGSDIDIYTFGTPINTVSLFTILLHLAIEINTWTVVHWVIMLGSVSLYFVVTLVYSAVCISCNPPSDAYWILQQYTYRVLINTVAPSPIVRARHLERLDPTTKEQWIRKWRVLRGESTWGVGPGTDPEIGAFSGQSKSPLPPPSSTLEPFSSEHHPV
ncbi:LOW QUALITY PROTEIN: phospholipid-transporting ATPase VB-like [Salvelinus alpinus]